MSTPTAEKAPAVIAAWELYRRSQLLPATPDLIRAQAVLWDLLEPHTRTGEESRTGPDLDVIEDAADRLVNAVEWLWGREAADRVAGDGGEMAA